MGRFADYVVYADESGDHSLTSVDTTYPVFVLCLCIFHKKIYTKSIVPRVQGLKFSWFGHDAIILHERDIRKRIAPFDIFRTHVSEMTFMEDIGHLMRTSPFRISAAVIDKNRLASDMFYDQNAYEIALEACLMLTNSYLEPRVECNSIVHFIFEKRGKKEDAELELAFRRVIAGENSRRRKLPNYEIIFVDKKANSSGMQLADLTARPIGLHAVRPHQTNKAFEIIKRKLIRRRTGRSISKSVIMFP